MIWEIARREVTTRARSKAFKVTSAILLVLAIGGVVGAAVFADDDNETETIEVGAVGIEDGIADAVDATAPAGLTFEFVQLADREVDEAVSSGDVDVAVVAAASGEGPMLVWNSTPNELVRTVIVQALVNEQVDDRAGELGLSDADVSTLLAAPDLDERFVDPPSDSDSARTAVGLFSVLITFFAIQFYGSQIALVVVEEKANRIIEILLALVRPRDLLTGKIMGVGILAFVHVLILVVGIVVALAVSGFTDVPVSAYVSLPLLLVMFVLGFTLYGALFALVGSLVSRQEDTQQALVPVFIPVFIGYVIALQAGASPESILPQAAAVVPFTSPFVLPVVVANGAASVVLVVASIVLLIAGTIGVVLLAARVYQFTLLRTGSRITLREAFRLSLR